MIADADDATAVVVDTMVFIWQFAPTAGGEAALYAPLLAGRQVVLSFVSVEEVRFGALDRGWGQGRVAQLEERLTRVAVAPYDDRLASVAAELRASCKAVGHPLHEKVHTADRWIAATALRYALPLVTHDGVFDGAPGLDVITAKPVP